MHRTVAFVLMSVVVNAAHAAPPEIVSQYMPLFATLMETSKGLPPNYELAAFLVRDAEDHVQSVLWPRSGMPKRSTYHGTIPAGSVAIAHTHPQHLQEPSAQDIAMAQQTGLHIYVLTRGEIWVAEGRTGRVVRLVRNRAWSAITQVSRPPVRQAHAMVAASDR